MTNTFLQDIEAEGASLISAAQVAWNDARTELEALEQQVLQDVKTAISTVVREAEAGASIEQMETAVLNLLQAEATTIIKGLTSGALQVLIVFAKAAL